MPLLKNGAIVADDWITLGLDDPRPESGDIVIPYAISTAPRRCRCSCRAWR
jgi:hypothetical protein